VQAKLISVIGPPAVGKTTLAGYLADELPAEFVKEDYQGNPFLVDSYLGGKQARLPAQLYFLLSRVRQLSAAELPESGLAVSDYGYCQDGLFARLRLSRADFELYQAVAKRVGDMVCRPAMLICMDASVEELTGRIARRGRAYEESISKRLLSAMRKEYRTVAASATCSVIEVDTEALDIRDGRQRSKLIDEIRQRL